MHRYSEFQKVLDNYTNVEFHDWLPDLNAFDGKSRTLLVPADLITSNTEHYDYYIV